MTMATHQMKPRLRLDVPSLLLFLVGVVSGTLAYLLITYANYNALILVPGVVAATIGLSHLFKREAGR